MSTADRDDLDDGLNEYDDLDDGLNEYDDLDDGLNQYDDIDDELREYDDLDDDPDASADQLERAREEGREAGRRESGGFGCGCLFGVVLAFAAFCFGWC
jgi:hypothetical protein